ncbi:MAG: hypothetical protein KatS3mg101_1166 [Patescibacteria group bacterium]|nr:MAG: hypothetical protein KatS3mg101_1166 [Patescibacteria group bacterium]
MVEAIAGAVSSIANIFTSGNNKKAASYQRDAARFGYLSEQERLKQVKEQTNQLYIQKSITLEQGFQNFANNIVELRKLQEAEESKKQVLIIAALLIVGIIAIKFIFK